MTKHGPMEISSPNSSDPMVITADLIGYELKTLAILNMNVIKFMF